MKLFLVSMVSVLSLVAITANAEELRAAKSTQALQALHLTEEVPPPVVPVPTSPSMDCRGLVARVQETQTKLRALQSSTVSTIYDAASTMRSWYYQLSADEGRTVYVPYGSYRVVLQSANTETANAEFADTRFNALNAELSSLIADLSRCF